MAAALLWLGHADDLPRFWVATGVYAGLIPVVMFFLVARAMFGPRAAATGTALFALLNSAITPAYLSGGYSPWLLIPLLAQAFFLGSIWLIHAHAARGGWVAGVAIGAAIGATFLAHAVPGILLCGIVVAATLADRAVCWRTVAWLALVGIVLVLVMAPYAILLAVIYPAGIVHLAPGGWVAGLLRTDWHNAIAMLLINTPLLVGLALMWRKRAWPDRVGAAMIGTWIGLCALALGRHYACAGFTSSAPACVVLRVPVHHFHLYLQIAAPLVLGAALAAMRPVSTRARILAAAATGLGIALLFMRPHDSAERAIGLGQTGPFVRSTELYRWIRNEAPADVMYVTTPDAPPGMEANAAPFIVMGAARRLLVAHSIFSNPYVDWSERDRMRHAVLDWLDGSGTAPPAALPCARTWVIVPPDFRSAPDRGTLVHRDDYYRVFDIHQPECPKS